MVSLLRFVALSISYKDDQKFEIKTKPQGIFCHFSSVGRATVL